jgi:ATP-dependent helicase/nuclease subunit B
MRLVFDPDFDQGAWPGPLAGKDAAFAEAWVGPLGLLAAAETALGLGGRWAAPAARAAALVPAVRSVEGFWSRSAEADPLGTADVLLRWRDELMLSGWLGEPVAPRLAALAAVTRDALPGLPDRLRAALTAIAQRGTGGAIREVVHIEEAAELPLLWRSLLGALRESGVAVVHAPLSPAPAAGDLAEARHGRFTPHADGSLFLLRASGVLAAADHAAAWIADRRLGEAVAVVTPDGTLDAALRRFGLPTLGGASEGNLLPQVLPLVLKMAWTPPDPQQALDLLTLPTGPIPGPVASRLAGALHEWPAVDSDAWRRRLPEALARIGDADRAAAVAERVGAVFRAAVPRGRSYPAGEVHARVRLVDAWARGHAESGPDREAWGLVSAQCAELVRLLGLAGLAELPPAQLEWFVAEATRVASATPRYPAEAGLHAVRCPGAVAGPARAVVWWDFTSQAAPLTAGLPLAPAELLALRAAGVRILEAGSVAAARAARWRRPLLQTTEALLLVCPRFGDDGEERFPHPLWTEIAGKATDAGTLQGPRPPLGRRTKTKMRPLGPLPRAVRAWQVAGVEPRLPQSVSPTSLGDLIGCSFRFAVRTHAAIQPGRGASLSTREQLWGRLVHDLLHRLFEGPPLSAAEARAQAGEVFDRQAPRLAAALFLPGSEVARAEVRRATQASAETLFALMREAKLRPISVESLREREAFGTALRGQPDVVLGDPPAVVDLKWAGASYYARALATGSSYQLAAYSYLVSDERAPAAPVAYFILSSQRTITNERGPFAGAEVVAGPSLRDTWTALHLAFDDARRALEGGSLTAAGVAEDDAEELLPEGDIDAATGRLRLAAPCRFCELGALCGREIH